MHRINSDSLIGHWEEIATEKKGIYRGSDKRSCEYIFHMDGKLSYTVFEFENSTNKPDSDDSQWELISKIEDDLEYFIIAINGNETFRIITLSSKKMSALNLKTETIFHFTKSF